MSQYGKGHYVSGKGCITDLQWKKLYDVLDHEELLGNNGLGKRNALWQLEAGSV